MPTSFPTGLDSLTNPVGSDPTTSPDHAAQHSNANDAIEALEAKVGITASAVSTSLDYQMENHAHTASADDGGIIAHSSLSGLTSGDPHTQYQLRSEEDAASGYVGLSASSIANIAGGVTVGSLSLTTTALQTTMSSAAARKHLAMITTGAEWDIWMGTETIPYLYIGGSGGTSQYFWRANWNATADPANTFKSASGTAGQIPLAVMGATSQSANLQEWRDVTPTTLLAVTATGAIDAPQQTAPANPAAGTRRIFTDTATGKLSVRTSGGSTISLEEQGGGVTYATTAELADVTKAAENAGASTTVARGDHKHDITTAAPSGGSEGTATTLARSDHAHAGGTGVASSVAYTTSTRTTTGTITSATTGWTSNSGLGAIIWQGGGAATIYGLAGGGTLGAEIMLVNDTAAQTITLKHADGTEATANNRLFLPNAADYTLGPGKAATFVYGSTDKWILIDEAATYSGTPAILGTASAGTAATAPARGDHVHAKATENELNLSDVLTFNVSISRHGFVPKAPNDPLKFLAGDGNWLFPVASFAKLGDTPLSGAVTISGGTGITLTEVGSNIEIDGSSKVLVFNSRTFAQAGDQMPELFVDSPMAIDYIVASGANRLSVLTVDVKKNGTTIYPSATKPTVPSGAGSQLGTRRTPDTTALTTNDKLTINFSSSDFSVEDKVIVYIGVHNT